MEIYDYNKLIKFNGFKASPEKKGYVIEFFQAGDIIIRKVLNRYHIEVVRCQSCYALCFKENHHHIYSAITDSRELVQNVMPINGITGGRQLGWIYKKYYMKMNRRNKRIEATISYLIGLLFFLTRLQKNNK